MKYVTLALLVYLIFTVAVLIGPARSFQTATSLDWGISPQKVSASQEVVPNIVLQTLEVRVPTAPYIIVGPAN